VHYDKNANFQHCFSQNNKKKRYLCTFTTQPTILLTSL